MTNQRGLQNLKGAAPASRGGEAHYPKMVQGAWAMSEGSLERPLTKPREVMFDISVNPRRNINLHVLEVGQIVKVKSQSVKTMTASTRRVAYERLGWIVDRRCKSFTIRGFDNDAFSNGVRHTIVRLGEISIAVIALTRGDRFDLTQISNHLACVPIGDRQSPLRQHASFCLEREEDPEVDRRGLSSSRQ